MRPLMPLVAIVLVLSGCSDLGLGEADCGPIESDVSPSNILTVQAVPTAKYTPCFDELPLAWDNADWSAENGRAVIEIARFAPPSEFLKVTVTERCNVSDAIAVESGFPDVSKYPDIERFEDIEEQAVDIEISIIPSGELPLSTARQLVEDLAEDEIKGRPVIYHIDDALDETVSTRAERALLRHDYVWIVDEVDAQEGTVELRSNISAANDHHDLQPAAALGLIEDVVPEVSYRGNWYFTFEGGCITYDFNAKGALAETVAADAEETFGFFPALELREFAREEGFDVG